MYVALTMRRAKTAASQSYKGGDSLAIHTHQSHVPSANECVMTRAARKARMAYTLRTYAPLIGFLAALRQPYQEA
jgi:hypothetical protein